MYVGSRREGDPVKQVTYRPDGRPLLKDCTFARRKRWPWWTASRIRRAGMAGAWLQAAGVLALAVVNPGPWALYVVSGLAVTTMLTVEITREIAERREK